MKYLQKILVVTIVIGFFGKSFGQDLESRKDKIEAQRIAYITQQINLTSSEAEIFWPVYNEFQDKKRNILKQKKLIMLRYEQKDYASEAELEQLVDKFINLQVGEAEMLKSYHQEFKKILGVEKVVKLYRAENHFKQYLLKQIKGQGAGEMRGRRF